MPSTSISGMRSLCCGYVCSAAFLCHLQSVCRYVKLTPPDRLDDDYIVFRGGPAEAASAHLKGTVVLCLSEPLTIKHLKLQLIGIARVG